jgi:HD-GYP domain-containing protein (c-di-GMP phosphodiesterase class II)
VAAADVYDAMITLRPYKDSLASFAAFELFSTVGMAPPSLLSEPNPE